MTMEVDEQGGEGLKLYYITKIEELQLTVNEKTQNLRRLQAQRNELNAKGMCQLRCSNRPLLIVPAFLLSSNAP